MIVVLCYDWQDAKDAYFIFCSFLDRYEPFMIKENDEYSLRVVTDEDLVYIFTDERFKGVFVEGVDMIGVDEFFEDLYSHYDADVFEDFHYGWIPW